MSSSTTSTPSIGPVDAVVGRARIDVNDSGAQAGQRVEAAAEPLPFVPADRDDAEVAHGGSLSPGTGKERRLRIWAGTPTAIEPGGMSAITRAFAPIRLSWPTVTPPATQTLQPISTRSSIVGIASAG